jgi:hypothetical protein
MAIVVFFLFMAIVALFFLNSRGDSIAVKKPWWFLANSREGCNLVRSPGGSVPV